MKKTLFYSLSALFALVSVVLLTSGIGCIYAKYFTEAIYIPFRDFLALRSVAELSITIVVGVITGLLSGVFLGKGLN